MDFSAIRHQFFTAFLQWLLQEAQVVIQAKEPLPTSNGQPVATNTGTPAT